MKLSPKSMALECNGSSNNSGGAYVPPWWMTSAFISPQYLMFLHPDLSTIEANQLYDYSISRTIRYKGCYGPADESLVFMHWKTECEKADRMLGRLKELMNKGYV